jgi:hypothetical protein
VDVNGAAVDTDMGGWVPFASHLAEEQKDDQEYAKRRRGGVQSETRGALKSETRGGVQQGPLTKTRVGVSYIVVCFLNAP